MPKHTEIATILAGGERYETWQAVSISRDLREITTQMNLTVAEIGDLKHGWKSLRLKPGDPCTAYLAGQLAASGYVIVRQVAYDANAHGVQFIVQSKVADLLKSTANPSPGQFRNYTLSQIAGAVLKPFGINFSSRGMAEGADKPFPRVSVHFGETVFELLERLCRMRNLSMIDDENGNIVAMRGPLPEIVADLQEGRNILSAQMVWRDDVAFSGCKVCTQQPGNDHVWGDAARASAAVAVNPHYSRYAPLHLVAEEPGDSRDAQMRADHERDANVASMLNVNVTLHGWLRDGTTLWLNEVGKSVSLFSPMLFPQERITLGIQAVACSQSDRDGTTTTLTLTLPRLLQSGNQIAANGPTVPNDAQAKAPDA